MPSPAARLRLLPPELEPLSRCVQPGRLVELSGHRDALVPGARTTAAVSVLAEVQREGETAAWIQPEGGPLFPPDLDQSGIDLDALLVVHVPRPGGDENALPFALCKAAELLLRSGAFGLLILDFCERAPPSGSEAWQGRLLGLCRQHDTRILLLTEKPTTADSLGPLVTLRLEPHRYREIPPRHWRGGPLFTLEHAVLKNKSGVPLSLAQGHTRGPWGLR
jgi:recombination protein RecA